MSGILSAICTNYVVSSAFPSTVKVLVVGGGGAGGGDRGGGGGAGGVIYNSAYAITDNTSYTVTIGNGGTGQGASQVANNGQNSVFDTLTAIGGGGGGVTGGGPFSPSVGGSGGGGGGGNGTPPGGATVTGAAGTASQGYAGGDGYPASDPNYVTGGGGGAGEVGGNATSTTGGKGGDGIANSISGVSVYYGGGGGGSFDQRLGGGSNGAGGNGGGGAGGNGSNGVNGTANTGGGGGGAYGFGSGTIGGSGGSGVVIISYVGDAIATGGTITSVGGNTIHTFTSSGNFVVGTPAPVIPTSGLVNEWLLQANANDTVGSANLTTNGITFGTTGGKASAAYATNGYALKSSFPYPSASTIIFWAYLNDTSSSQYLIKCDGGAPSLYIALRSSEPTDMIMSFMGSTANITRSEVLTGAWTLIAITSDGTTMKSYLNNVLKNSTSASAGGGTSNLNIGGYDTNTGENPHGSIRDVRLYNRVLTTQELTDYYNVG